MRSMHHWPMMTLSLLVCLLVPIGAESGPERANRSTGPAAGQGSQLPELRTEQDRVLALQRLEQWLTGVIAEARSGRGARIVVEGTGRFAGFAVVDRQATAEFLDAQVVLGAIAPAERTRQAQALSVTSPAALANAERQLQAIRRQLRDLGVGAGGPAPPAPGNSSTQAQAGGPPAGVGWHSVTAAGGAASPLDLDQRSCFERAQAALRANGFGGIQGQDGWTTSGTGGPLRAGISCVAMGNRSQVDISVTGAFGTEGETARMRDVLRDYMLRGGGVTSADADALGVRWDERELEWTGTWTRQSCTSTFAASWTNPGGGEVQADLSINLAGNAVTIDRSVNGRVVCRYTGALAADGLSAQGTYGCETAPGPFAWSATITKGSCVAPSGATEFRRGGVDSGILGVRWDEEEQGWKGVWTRRGNTNTFDGTWTRAGSSPVVAELTIEIRGNQVSITRQGGACNYTGTLAADGLSVQGTYGCVTAPGPFPWRAVIRHE